MARILRLNGVHIGRDKCRAQSSLQKRRIGVIGSNRMIQCGEIARRFHGNRNRWYRVRRIQK